VTRRGRAWPTATAPLGPAEALGIDRALRAICVDPAISAGETDRGRLTPGMRADIVVVPAAALDEPVLPGGPLGTVRPRLVIVDGVDAAGA
jgi:predicted amidohydrolase YtcJ